MQEELRRKAVVGEYFRRLNAGDVSGVLALFTEDVRIEDPVGGGPRDGRAAQHAYVADQVAGGTRLTPGRASASHDDEHVAVPYTVRVHGRETSALGIFRIDARGLIKEYRAFWGLTDRE